MGRSHPLKRLPDGPARQTSPGITDHRPGISGHFRAFPGIVRASSDTKGSSRPVSSVAGHTVPYGPSLRYDPSPDRVPSGSSRAVSPVAGHSVGDGRRVRYGRSSGTASGMVVACGRVRRRIACAMTCRRIACRQACRVRYRPSPDRVPSRSSRAVSSVAGHGVRGGRRVPYRSVPDRVPYGPSPDRVSSHIPVRFGDPGVPGMVTVGRAERPSSAMPRPNSAL